MSAKLNRWKSRAERWRWEYDPDIFNEGRYENLKFPEGYDIQDEAVLPVGTLEILQQLIDG